jgi:hypothetical protein
MMTVLHSGVKEDVRKLVADEIGASFAQTSQGWAGSF